MPATSRLKLQSLLVAACAVLLSATLLPGCSATTGTSAETQLNASDQAQLEAVEQAREEAGEQAQQNAAQTEARSAGAQVQSGEAAGDAPGTSVDLASVPVYEGSPYVELYGNAPQFSNADKARASFEEYSDLDALGRCGTAFALVGTETMPTEKRGSIGMVKPSGWHTVRYDGLVDGNYLYNRCHLIGYQLAGENANTKNLITGTRYLNVVGMLPFEDEVADYVDRTSNHVLYRVTPVFEGSNLVASGVQMEAWSVEDGGAGVSFNIYCYNVQPGVNIDYATGSSSRVEEGTGESEAQDGTQDAAEDSYVLNTSSKKFHKPSCSSVGRMKDANKQEFTGTRQELIDKGYSPCGNCNP